VKIVDLSRGALPRHPRTYPGHPPIIHGVWKTHEQSFVESGNVHGLASMFISMPDHAGTHIGRAQAFRQGPASRSANIRWRTAIVPGHLHRPAPYRGPHRDHAGRSGNRGEALRPWRAEGRHRGCFAPAINARQLSAQGNMRARIPASTSRPQSGWPAARRGAFRHRLDAAGARGEGEFAWCTRPASNSASPTSRACCNLEALLGEGPLHLHRPADENGATARVSPIRAVGGCSGCEGFVPRRVPDIAMMPSTGRRNSPKHFAQFS